VSQLLRFEGSTPEEARTKARRALGDDVLIVRAGRERRGGVLGFFEQECYVLEVDASSGTPPGSHPGAAAGMLPGPVGVADRLADDVEDAVDLGRDRVSAGGFGAAGQPARAALPRRTGIESPLEFSEVLREAEAAVSSVATGFEHPWPGETREQPPGAGYAAASPAAAPPAAEPAPIGHEARLAVSEPSPWHHASDATLLEDPAPPMPAPGHELIEASATAAGTAPGGPPDADARARRLLAELGLPGHLMPGDDLPFELGLVDRLRSLPAAPEPPQLPDAVVLVAGPAEHLGPLALHLARRLGSGAEAIVVVSTRLRGLPSSVELVDSARDTAAQVADRRIARQPSVVAVDCRPVGPLPRLLAHVATAIRPDASWAIVPARCEADDLHALAEAMRGLDAICLAEFDAAERPAACLAAGYPVAAIDRRAATSLMWAARLIDRCGVEGLLS
jgi:hypothetical protein